MLSEILLVIAVSFMGAGLIWLGILLHPAAALIVGGLYLSFLALLIKLN